MRRARRLSLLTGLSIVFGGALPAADAPAYVPGRLLIGRARAGETASRRTLQAHRASVARRLPQLGASVIEVPEEASEAIRESLARSGAFEYVERDYYAHTAAVPDDPSYPLQWHLPRIQAPEAWDAAAGAGSVVVAVVDSGVDASHPEFAGRLVPGWSFLKGSADTSDVLGHGTAVAGTLAASANNGVAGAGVAWGSRIMPLAVVNASDFASYSNIAAAIQYAADHGVRIINVSIGGASPSATLQSAVDYAWSKGAVVFASAMNNGASTRYYPAACDRVVAVSATTSSDTLASFSNFGSWITLSAPGASILAPTMGGGSGYWYGTSFSAPVAAGVAALALSAEPSMTNEQLVALLKSNADDLGQEGFDSSFGWGRVNAYRAVRSASISVAIEPGPSTVRAAHGRQFTATVTGSTAGVRWSVSPAIGAISASGLYTAPANVAGSETITVTAVSIEAPDKSASVALTALPAIAVSMTPPAVALKASETAQFAAVAANSTAGVTWSIQPAIGGISTSGLYTAPAVVSTPVIVNVTAASVEDPAITASAQVSLGSSFEPIRVNAGGPAVVDSLGQTWRADYGFSGGQPWSTTKTISNTTAPVVHQTQRWGVFNYQFAVPNGSYLVTLLFSEASMTRAGQRSFNVAINGAPALTGFDIFANAGAALVAVERTFTVNVADGKIAIAFTQGSVNWPEVNGIQIIAGSGSPESAAPATPVRNTGGNGGASVGRRR